MSSDLEYLIAEGIGEHIDFASTNPVPFAPEPPDLARIHKLVRSRKCFTVLEFGIGYSTIVIADALRKNQQEWEAVVDRPVVRNSINLHCISVDTSQRWLERVHSQFPSAHRPHVTMQQSTLKIRTHKGQLSHL